MILAVKQYSDMCAVDWLNWVGAVEGPNCRAVVLGKPAAGGRGGEPFKPAVRREGNYY